MIMLASTDFTLQFSDWKTRLSHQTLHALRKGPAGSLPYQCCLLAMLAAVLYQFSFANGNDPLRYQSGLRNSPEEHPLNPKQLGLLMENLRQKTGYLEMHFDETGFLRLGDRMKISGGSATARELLIAAVDRARAIELQCLDHSRLVAFARLASPVAYTSYSTGKRIDVYPIQIDFSDFAHLRGDKVALAAFDLGFVVLHELAHAALGLHDSLNDSDGPGECEDYINRIRRELSLPERQNYIARTFSSRPYPSEKTAQRAELFFALKSEPQDRGKNQILNLTWEAERVGIIKQPDLKSPSVASKVQGTSAKPQTAPAP